MKKSETSKSPKRAADPSGDVGAKDAKKLMTAKAMVSPTTVSKVKEFCKNYAEFEVKAMEARTGDEDLLLFRQTCLELRKLMKEILELKLSSKGSNKTASEITEKRVEASLLFVTLKKLNRLDKLRLKKARDGTHDEKQKVDTFHLELENLLYEVFHLRKEVDKCLEFKSKDEDVELVPIEEFYQEAPANISKPEITKSNQHKLTLARLEWEFEQRKRLSEQCRILEENREKANSDINQKQKQLESLLPRLNTILETTRPLQDEFNLPLERIKFQRELSALLPDCLYILYSQMKAFIEACDQSMQITIEGKLEDAQNFGSDSRPPLDEVLEDVDSAESDVEMDLETSKRSLTSSKGTKENSQLRRHPLQIQLTIEKAVVVVFSYWTTLNLIAVNYKASSPDEKTSAQLCAMDNLLSGLFKDDDGEISPNLVNSYQMVKSATVFKSGEMGKPFLWAQWLAGLNFDSAVKSAPTAFVNTDFVGSVVRALKDRIKHRFELEKVLILLEKGDLRLDSEINSSFPPALSSRLVSWSAISFEECAKTSKHVEQLITANQINVKNVMIFNGLISRDAAKMKVVALVPINYPNLDSLVTVEIEWHEKHNRLNSEMIRSVEADVNVHHGNLPEKLKINLLILQLKKLCLHLDLLTEIDGQLMKKGGGSWQTSHSRVEFPAEKMIPQLIKGHDRVPPTVYDSATGFFLHR